VPLLGFGEWLAQLTQPGNELRLMLSPHAAVSLRELAPARGQVILLAGPEGGLAPGEAQAAQSRGFAAVRLGPRVLRTETAALAALAAIQALWGDF
jgi:16S rRNA (uracil1498-N3)-methyltransferase